MYHIELTLENLKVIKLWYYLAKKIYGSSRKQDLTKLQRSITQKLLKTWRAVETFKVGRSEYIALTAEGDYLRYILENEETSVGQ